MDFLAFCKLFWGYPILDEIITIVSLSRNVYIAEGPDSPETIRRLPALSFVDKSPRFRKSHVKVKKNKKVSNNEDLRVLELQEERQNQILNQVKSKFQGFPKSTEYCSSTKKVRNLAELIS